MGFVLASLQIDSSAVEVIAKLLDAASWLLSCIEGGIMMDIYYSFSNRLKGVVAWLGGGESKPIKRQGF